MRKPFLVFHLEGVLLLYDEGFLRIYLEVIGHKADCYNRLVYRQTKYIGLNSSIRPLTPKYYRWEESREQNLDLSQNELLESWD